MKSKLLSFCITCMNRLDQIKKTLPQNLKDNKYHQKDIEFVLVDFGTENLKEWILENFKSELDSNYLVYYYTDELKFWHSPIAKNTSHLLASGKYLVNLDCDNYTGYEGGNWVLKQFEKYDNLLIHQSLNIFESGTMGRIGMSRENFLKLGGYNQQFKPMGHQDGDIINRGKKLGLNYQNLTNQTYNKALLNDKDRSVENCQHQYHYKNMMKVNMFISQFNIKSNELKANNYFKTPQLGVLINIYRINNDIKIKIK